VKKKRADDASHGRKKGERRFGHLVLVWMEWGKKKEKDALVVKVGRRI